MKCVDIACGTAVSFAVTDKGKILNVFRDVYFPETSSSPRLHFFGFVPRFYAFLRGLVAELWEF